jgi:hypothetical protein
MAERRTAGATGTGPIELDVLIIGGGVMGLWLLNALHQERYAALLLERRELGGEQTCHSHVYIHQGHLYREVDLAVHLLDVRRTWEQWVRQRQPQYGVTPSYFGFQNPADATERTRLWTDPRLGLTYEPVPVPSPLQGGVIRVVLQSPEICLDGASLVRKLSYHVRRYISRIEEVRDVRVNAASGAVETVVVRMPRRVDLTFRPRALLLTAGAGNQALLHLASGGRHPWLGRVQDVQQIRKSHMLVIKGKTGHLPPLTGVFPSLRGLFIVSRVSSGETVWLVSDYTGPTLVFVEDGLVYDARWWLPGVVAALRRLAPRVFRYPERLQWGVYEAPKAEGRAGGSLPHEERVEPCGFTNLWTIWPTKLTLAPKVSHTVMTHIRQLIPQPGAWGTAPPTWVKHRQTPAIAPERWQKTPLMSWDVFRQCYHVS